MFCPLSFTPASTFCGSTPSLSFWMVYHRANSLEFLLSRKQHLAYGILCKSWGKECGFPPMRLGACYIHLQIGFCKFQRHLREPIHSSFLSPGLQVPCIPWYLGFPLIGMSIRPAHFGLYPNLPQSGNLSSVTFYVHPGVVCTWYTGF